MSKRTEKSCEKPSENMADFGNTKIPWMIGPKSKTKEFITIVNIRHRYPTYPCMKSQNSNIKHYHSLTPNLANIEISPFYTI